MGKRSPKKGKRIPVYIFLISLLILFGILYIFPTVTGALAKTTVIEYGSLQVVNQVTCYFVRDESVVNATSTGPIQYYFEEGELVRKGTKVLDLVPAVGNAYYVPDNLIVSYYIDGHENFFSPDNLPAITKEQVKDLELIVHDTHRESAISGEPLYKLVDNSTWYVFFWVGSEDVINYKKDGDVTLRLPLGNVKGTTYDIIEENGAWKVILAFTKYYEDMTKLRTIEAEVVTSDYEGLMVPNESITTKDGKPGVYVKDISREFVFTPVSVITSDGQYSLVESSFFDDNVNGATERISTVEVYDEILNHPKGEE